MSILLWRGGDGGAPLRAGMSQSLKKLSDCGPWGWVGVPEQNL
jgi:hypothetical protein